MKHLSFHIKPLRPRETVRLPAAFLALLRDPHALDHVREIDMDAIHHKPQEDED